MTTTPLQPLATSTVTKPPPEPKTNRQLHSTNHRARKNKPPQIENKTQATVYKTQNTHAGNRAETDSPEQTVKTARWNK
ncbi:hypothetical protein P8452_71778 [Trifolium repens]|nr:hypothetical protein P8452_71778 [Trifolium repens]